MFVLVYLDDSMVFGPFESEQAGYDWAKRIPNALFWTQEDWEHASGNSDFWVTKLTSPDAGLPLGYREVPEDGVPKDTLFYFDGPGRRRSVDHGILCWDVGGRDRYFVRVE